MYNFVSEEFGVYANRLFLYGGVLWYSKGRVWSGSGA